MKFSSRLARLKETVSAAMPFPSLGPQPPTREAARAMVSRYSLEQVIGIRAFDTANDLMVYDEGDDRISLAAVFDFTPLIAAGLDSENDLAMIIRDLAPGATMQFGMLGWPDIHHQLMQWYAARTENAPREIYKKLAAERVRHYKRAAKGLSLTREGDLFPRDFRCYLTIFFPGPVTLEERFYDRFLRETIRQVDNLKGKMRNSGMGCRQMPEFEVLRLYRMLYNPNLSAEELDDRIGLTMGKANGQLPRDIMDKSTRMRVTENGDLEFSGDGVTTHSRVMTVDTYPEEHYLAFQRKLVGDILDRSSRIAAPFWAYTNIVSMDGQAARDALMRRLGIMNKQSLSDSAWFRSMLGGMIRRKNDTEAFIQNVSESGAVRAYTGINIYATPDRIEDYADSTRQIWGKPGFLVSRERHISLPVFMASNPGGYTPHLDPPNKGLQRSEMMTTLNAATLSFCASDWRGTDIRKGGPLLVSRRGQIASLDLFSSSSGYNFAIAAKTGAGKSFIANEICIDFLSRNGIVRIVDIGFSYQKLCDHIDGQVIEYDIEDPKSINPFWGIESWQVLSESMTTLKAMLLLMGYPADEPDPWIRQTVETVIEQAWHQKGVELGLADIHAHFLERAESDGEKRYKDFADQIAPFAIGRLSAWFNNQPEVSFKNDFCILELEGLNADKDLRNVVFAQALHSISNDMYRAKQQNGNRPKLLLIDEAWSLLDSSTDSGTASKFIEEAARRIRKYDGSLGTITQGYNDYYQSSAATAALDNSEWRFTLGQKPGSLSVAKEKEVFSKDDDLTWSLLSTVESGVDYSEIHIADSKAGEVFRFFVDPFSYWLYTTNPKDKTKLFQYQLETNGTMMDAVHHFASEWNDRLDAELVEIQYHANDIEVSA